jgi:putative spermidine/putrescine transport system substrate-binding protein
VGVHSDYCYPFDSYGMVMAWNTRTVGADGPASWAEFWDTDAFPGRRALRANAHDLLEIALMSEDVPPAQLYAVLSQDGGIDRAVARLEQLRAHASDWWISGAQAVQIPKDGVADLVVTWSGRAASARDDGGTVEYSFRQLVIGTDCLAVPKCAPNVQAAMQMIAAMTTP